MVYKGVIPKNPKKPLEISGGFFYFCNSNPLIPRRSFILETLSIKLVYFQYFCIMVWRFLILVCLYCSCANIKEIKGGEVDKIPPKFVQAKSSQNFQINSKPKKLKLTFNEWVRLQNPSQNIIFSPNLEYPVKYKLKGKAVLIEFDDKEVLRDSTTYSISFGSAIEDISEKNTSNNFKFVFSTGNYIDSIELKGKVVDAFSGEPLDKILVTLYDDLSDTAFTKKKPLYICFSNKDGEFSFSNLKSNTYNIYSLSDKNLNYYFDQTTEAIGFHSNPIKVFHDTMLHLTLMRHSLQLLPIKIINKSELAGRTNILFNRTPINFKVRSLLHEKAPYQILSDTFVFYNTNTDLENFELSYEGKIDTIKIKASKFNKSNLSKIKAESNLILPQDEFQLKADLAIVDIDYSKVSASFVLDSSNFKIDPNKPSQVKVKIPNKAKREFIYLDSLAIKLQDSSGTLRDTFYVDFYSKERLANLEITIDSLIENEQYIFQLYADKKVVIENIFTTKSPTQLLEINNIVPGKYHVKLIQDSNKNMRWDPANFKDKKMPEEVFSWQIQELRADWKLKVDLKP